MDLILIRNIYTPVNTIGDLLIEHSIFCHTLEDVVRHYGSKKVYGETAIPSGRYKVILSMSNRFKRIMPEILEVPNFTGVRMHGGNTAKDTEGCIIISKNIINKSMVQGSMEKEITEILRVSDGPHFLEIINTYPYRGTYES
jgi:hypothetical protein